MMWVLAVAYAMSLVFVLGLCRAAAGDRRQDDLERLWAEPEDLAAHYAAIAAFVSALCRAAPDDLDDLERLYAEPDRYCPACGTWLAGDALFDSPECQAWFWEHDDA